MSTQETEASESEVDPITSAETPDASTTATSGDKVTAASPDDQSPPPKTEAPTAPEPEKKEKPKKEEPKPEPAIKKEESKIKPNIDRPELNKDDIDKLAKMTGSKDKAQAKLTGEALRGTLRDIQAQLHDGGTVRTPDELEQLKVNEKFVQEKLTEIAEAYRKL